MPVHTPVLKLLQSGKSDTKAREERAALSCEDCEETWSQSASGPPHGERMGGVGVEGRVVEWWRDLSCPVSCLSLSLLFLLSTHPDWAAEALQSQLPISQLATVRSSLLVLLLRFSHSLPHVLLH